MSHHSEAGRLVIDLERAAIRTEGKGQLAIARWLRASAAAVVREAAATHGFPNDPANLATDLRHLAGWLEEAGIDAAITVRIALGAGLIERAEQACLDRFPDPFVCRRCGTISIDPPSSCCDRCGAHELTFERFRPVYWLTEYMPDVVVGRLDGNTALFRAAIDSFLPLERQRWKPPGTAWSALDVLRHVRDADSVLATRAALILEEDCPHLAFQPVFAWTDAAPEASETLETVFATYTASRSATLSRLVALPPEDWQRTGKHEELGRVTLAGQASYFAAHELIHLRQLEQLRRALDQTPDRAT